MYNEVPVVGKYYKFGDWKEYTVHDDQNIKGFFGDYRWLSNFHKCRVFFEGWLYPSAENAYQSSKVDVDYRPIFCKIEPNESKKEWKKHPRIDDSKEEWDERKYDVMSVIVFDKFYRNKDLRKKLLDTGSKYLEETNHWKDQFWGVDINLGGTNHLGKILMKIRTYWKD